MHLYTTEPESHYERQLRIANTEYAKVLKQRDDLLAATKALLAEPHGCPMCHAGKLINPAKGHWDDCPFAIAQAAVDAVPNMQSDRLAACGQSGFNAGLAREKGCKWNG